MFAFTNLQVLVEELPLLLASMSFKRSMRWRGSTAYSRPLRWLMALHGSTVLPFTYAGMTATGITRLLRNSQDPTCQVSLLSLPSPPITSLVMTFKPKHMAQLCMPAL